MNGSGVLGLILNVSLLLSLAFLFDVVEVRWHRRQTPLQQVPVGFVIGAVGIVVMMTHWTFEPGLVFDMRSVLIGVSGLFFGPFATGIVMAMTSIFRFHQGGFGAWTGIAVILASGAIGIIWRRFRRRSLADLSFGELYVFGMVIHLVMLAIMFTLPWKTAVDVLWKLSVPLLLINPLGTALLGTLMVRRLRSERMQSELREKGDQYRAFFENSFDAAFLTAPDGRILAANPEACNTFGRTEEEIRRIGRAGLLDEKDPRLAGALVERARTGKFRGELTFLRNDGTPFPGEISSAVFRDRHGNLKTSMTVRDISERRKAEEALRKSEELFSTIFRASPVSIAIIGLADNRIKDANDAWLEATGLAREEAVGRRPVELGVWADPAERAGYLKILEERGVVENYEFKLRHKTGRIVNMLISGERIELSGEPCILSLGLDITDRKRAEEERKRLEARLVHAQKMEAVRTLAGGLAHDFNNLLMSMQGNVSLMLEELEPEHPHNEYLKSIEIQIRSAAKLIKQLLGVARSGHFDTKPSNINEIMENAAFIFARTRKDIRIHRNFEKNLWTSEVDPDQMGQVFMNLFINAGQAMPAGGDLYLKTGNVFLDEAFVRPQSAMPGRYVRISVTDTGSGMSENTMTRVFEPFFTTKERGRGTGLGLSMAYAIVKVHRGLIDFSSKSGQGSTFNIYLPASEQEAVPDASVSPEIIRGTGTILLVDDETPVLQTIQRMLEQIGYKVTAAQSGREAVDLYREKKAEIDLVLLDMIMPGMSGEEAFRMLREINPEVKIILLSGYALEGQARRILETGGNGFIQKSVSLSELSRRIHELRGAGGEG